MREKTDAASGDVQINRKKKVCIATGVRRSVVQRRREKNKPQKQDRIRYDVYSFSPSEWVRYGLTGLGIGLFVVWICYRTLWAMPLAGVIMGIYLRNIRKQLAEDRRNQLNYQFRDLLASLHTTMLAGYSLENAVTSSAADLEKLYGKDSLISVELRTVVRQMSYQIPVEKLFLELGRRSGVEDIRTFGEVIAVAKRTGGSMGEVLRTSWQTLGDRIETKKEIDTMMASRRYEMKIMNLMPAGILLYLKISFGGLLDPMYGNPAGAAVMTACLVIYLAAVFLGKKLMDIRV